MAGESGVVRVVCGTSEEAHSAWEAGQKSAFCFSKAQDRRCLVCGAGGRTAEGFLYLGFDR